MVVARLATLALPLAWLVGTSCSLITSFGEEGLPCAAETPSCLEGYFCINGLCQRGTCQPGAKRCAGDKAMEVCSADGREWLAQECSSSQVCSESTNECVFIFQCHDDGLEPNNSKDQAWHMAPGEIQDLTICTGDQDFFAVELEENEELRAEISFAPSDTGDLDLAILDSSGATLASSTGEGGTERVGIRADVADIYLIRVLSPDYGHNEYSLWVAASMECVDDGLEPNDDPVHASSGEAQTFLGLELCPDDDDWFRVSLPPYQSLRVTLWDIFPSSSSRYVSLDLMAEDPSQGLLPLTSALTVNWELAAAITQVQSQEILVRVSASEGAQLLSYALDLRVLECPDDRYEPNDSLEWATRIDDITSFDGQGLQVCGSAGENDPTWEAHQDWYLVNAPSQDTHLVVSMTHVNLQGDLDLAIYDKSGSRLLRESRIFGDNDELDVVGEDAYLIRVFGSTSTVQNDYQLILQ